MAAKRNDVTEDSLLDELEQARLKAMTADNGASAMVQATLGKAKLVGLLVERREQGKPGEFESMGEQELRAWLADNADRQEQESTQAGGDSAESVSNADRESVASAKVGVAATPPASHDSAGPEPINTTHPAPKTLN